MLDAPNSRFLDYLPAVLRQPPAEGQESLLARFLPPFETVFGGLEGVLAELDRYFAPAFTDPEFLPWLANWVALVLDEDWPEAKRRRLITEAVDLYRLRGTLEGLRRYLEIYTGLPPIIREWHWPGGMQIGVASRIGGMEGQEPKVPSRIQRFERITPITAHDYYVVDTVAEEGHPEVKEGRPLRIYYRADRVESVAKDGSDVTVVYDGMEKIHSPATVTRRDGLIDQRYRLPEPGQSATEADVFRGDTVLIEEAEDTAYRFIVEVRVPQANKADVKLDKVRAIVESEKPAHTQYYLKLTLY